MSAIRMACLFRREGKGKGSNAPFSQASMRADDCIIALVASVEVTTRSHPYMIDKVKARSAGGARPVCMHHVPPSLVFGLPSAEPTQASKCTIG